MSFLQQHEIPRFQRRLEIDEREIVRPAVDLDLDLERGHQHPIEREQNDERPEPEQSIDDDLGTGAISSRLSASNRRRQKLRFLTASLTDASASTGPHS